MRSVTRSLILVTLLAVAGCGSAASSPPAQSGHHSSHHNAAPARSTSVVISVRGMGKMGEVLTSSQGYALYMFAPDKRNKVSCTGLCAAMWPPVIVPAGASFAAGHGVQASLLGSDPDPGFGRVATYGGWPLYRYVGDTLPGQASGQGVNLNGGYWYLMQPSGRPLTGSSRS
jgi:predicted lipoprotein with Yx(FWY)xxD motif